MKTKPRDEKCHDLYVKWAIRHLLILRNCLYQLDVGNLNMCDAYCALYREMDKLIKVNPAYREANEFLEELSPFLLEYLRNENRP